MKTITGAVLIVALFSQTAFAATQKSVTPQLEATAMKQMVSAIPLGSRVKLQMMSGRRMTATLMAVSDEGVIVKRVSRVPEPAVTVPFSELTRLERDDNKGLSIGKAIGIGVATGAGAILTLFAIAMSIGD